MVITQRTALYVHKDKYPQYTLPDIPALQLISLNYKQMLASNLFKM